ncbi:hypothetical protein ERJ70_11605 [Sediminibacillus dalangtanensis]|uniref:Uncharacterized protein n=1 Tax=Sediminibacillus dalangtanensis TaxID=2729421 RepID=A0ABX7VZI8_9BACI|nr:hypothetical protein [Sediminibacillus dalangtanensis]QTM99882.1 hypothetical protein ERJ70_11605 [Sediminibacillus dalangtanensis]
MNCISDRGIDSRCEWQEPLPETDCCHLFAGNSTVFVECIAAYCYNQC